MGPSGSVQYPEFAEYSMQEILSGSSDWTINQGQRHFEVDTDDSMTEIYRDMVEQTNPYTGISPYDPATELSDLALLVQELTTHSSGVEPLTNWLAYATGVSSSIAGLIPALSTTSVSAAVEELEGLVVDITTKLEDLTDVVGNVTDLRGVVQALYDGLEEHESYDEELLDLKSRLATLLSSIEDTVDIEDQIAEVQSEYTRLVALTDLSAEVTKLSGLDSSLASLISTLSTTTTLVSAENANIAAAQGKTTGATVYTAESALAAALESAAASEASSAKDHVEQLEKLDALESALEVYSEDNPYTDEQTAITTLKDEAAVELASIRSHTAESAAITALESTLNAKLTTLLDYTAVDSLLSQLDTWLAEYEDSLVVETEAYERVQRPNLLRAQTRISSAASKYNQGRTSSYLNALAITNAEYDAQLANFIETRTQQIAQLKAGVLQTKVALVELAQTRVRDQKDTVVAIGTLLTQLQSYRLEIKRSVATMVAQYETLRQGLITTGLQVRAQQSDVDKFLLGLRGQLQNTRLEERNALGEIASKFLQLRLASLEARLRMRAQGDAGSASFMQLTEEATKGLLNIHSTMAQTVLTAYGLKKEGLVAQNALAQSKVNYQVQLYGTTINLAQLRRELRRDLIDGSALAVNTNIAILNSTQQLMQYVATTRLATAQALAQLVELERTVHQTYLNGQALTAQPLMAVAETEKQLMLSSLERSRTVAQTTSMALSQLCGLLNYKGQVLQTAAGAQEALARAQYSINGELAGLTAELNSREILWRADMLKDCASILGSTSGIPGMSKGIPWIGQVGNAAGNVTRGAIGTVAGLGGLGIAALGVLGVAGHFLL